VPFTVAPVTLLPAPSRPERFAGDHGFIDGAVPFDHGTSTGTFSPGRTRSRSLGIT